MSPRQPVALDACVLINLIASGRSLLEFAAAASLDFIVVVQVEREVLWLDPEDPEKPREQINLEPLVINGQLQRVVMAPQEVARFVALARELDDGEAATLAVAETRGLAVATDDRKARGVLTKLKPPPAVISTAAILRAWAAGRIDDEIRVCVNLIEHRASFLPPTTDPDSDWWRSWRS